MTVVPDTQTSRSLQLSRNAPAAAFLAVSLAVAVPILIHATLPGVDLPNHIARYAVMANPTGELGQYYSVPGFAAVPNSAVDLIWLLTGMSGDPIRFANAIFALYAVNLVASVMVLSRVLHGRWTVWPVVSGFLVYNGAFFWGFQNYLFSVPFAIYGLALWIATERRPTAVRLLIFLPFAAVLYLMHLFAFMALALLAFARELQELIAAGSNWPRRLPERAAMAVPFLLPILWMLSGPTGEQGTHTSFGGLDQRIEALRSPVSTRALDEAPFLTSFGHLGLAILILCLLTVFRRSGPRLVAHRQIVVPVLVLALAAAAAPMWLNGVAYVQIRLPFVVLAVLIAGTSWRGVSTRQATLILSVFAILIGGRSILFERYAAMNDREFNDLETVLAELPPGSRVLPLRAPGHEGMRRLWQAQAYAVTLRQSFVPTLFLGVHALQVRPEWLEYTNPALFAIDMRRILMPRSERPRARGAFWKDWEDVFTHALVMDSFDPALTADQPLREVGRSGRFTLLRVE